MSVRLAFGMTTGPGSRCWLPTPDGEAMPADDRSGAPGSPVAVGPAGAAPSKAVARLVSLVAAGTEVVAGAGVDLGEGFTSARLAGAPGDRRDAVLAALRLLGTQDAHRLGDRAAVLVALFGLTATKRVGAAANTAIVERQWAALQLASAASDLLGPEQLERVLELRAPAGTDPFPRGTASTLADHLSRVLARYQRPRRLALIVSLWDHVCTQQLDRQRRARLASSQVRADRIDRLRERYQDHFNASILQRVNWAFDGSPTLADAARWRPPNWWTAGELTRLLHDAVAATALLRFARTMYDQGLAAAAEQHQEELRAADACLTGQEHTEAVTRVEGAYSHPARPGCYVRDLVRKLHSGRPITDRTEKYLRTRTAMARNYGVVVLNTIAELLAGGIEPLHNCWDTCKPWQGKHLRSWRTVAGFHRSPAAWEQPPLTDANPDGPQQTLAQRIAADPTTDPAALEAPHDLLWYADLADALAPFHGHETAAVQHSQHVPVLDYDPPAPSHPRTETVPLAAAGVAQLVAFGATPPPRCRGWAELVNGVQTDAAVAEVSVGIFPVPAELSAVDKQVIPGTALSVELGRNPRQLADWSSYMGNCLGGPWYAEQARRGQCVVMALRDGDGRIQANLDIHRRRGGWQVAELKGRFNDALAPDLAQHITQWVRTLAPPEPPKPPAPPVPRTRSRTGKPRRSAATRLPTELIRALTTETERALTAPRTTAARRTYATLANNLNAQADFDPPAAVIALKRLGVNQLADLLRKALPEGLPAPTLWRATSVRPLTAAVANLDPALREYDRVTTLTEDAPLPKTLRALVRRPEIAPAHAMDVVARATRKAMGRLLSDPALSRSIARRPTPELVCAVVIATTCTPSAVDKPVRLATPGTTTAPGFPTTNLLDEAGPWQQALPAATDLGAPVAEFVNHIGEHGLLAPPALLGRGGWPALWQRAHR